MTINPCIWCGTAPNDPTDPDVSDAICATHAAQLIVDAAKRRYEQDPTVVNEVYYLSAVDQLLAVSGVTWPQQSKALAYEPQ